MTRRRVFVYEYLSAADSADDDADAALMPQGEAMRDALAADLLACGDCAVTVARGEHSAAVPPGADAVAARPGEPALDFVARQARLHDRVWVIAPESGGWLQRFAERTAPSRWVGCDAHAIAIASSKRRTLAQLAARGLPTPLAFAADPSVQRWVVKPDDGAGALDTRVHARLESARLDQGRRLEAGLDACVEPWIDGEALSLSLHCRGAGTELLSVNRQRIDVAAGGTLNFRGVDIAVHRAGDPRHDALAALAPRIAEAIPGLRGFVGVDLVWHAQRGPVLVEVNPRITCAYVGLSATLGRNLAAELLIAQPIEVLHA